MAHPEQQTAVSGWPVGAGQMAGLIRAFDWAATPLGPIDAWPRGLRTAVEIGIDSAFPTFVWWGSDLVELHNDAALKILQAKHPEALGKPAREVWADVWPVVGPLFEEVLRTGEPFMAEDLAMVPERGGPLDDAYFTFCYSVLRDEEGVIAGMQAVAIETTEKVRAGVARERAQTALRMNEEQQTFLLQLSDALRPLADPIEIQGTTARLLGDWLGATRVYYVEYDAEERCATVARDYVSDGSPSLVGRYGYETYRTVLERIGDGRTWIVNDVTGEDEFTLTEREVLATQGMIAWVDVPLIKHGTLVAILCVVQGAARLWTPDERVLVEETAERTWAAIERTRAEAALRTSEARYRTLFDSIDEGFVVVEVLLDAEGTAYDCLVIENNPSFDRMMRATDMVGKTALEIFPGAEDSWFEAYGHVVVTGEAIRIENYLGPLDAWFELYISRVGDDYSHRIAIVFNDITERKRSEAVLRESEASLQERVAAATAELRSLSHRLLTVQEEERRHLARELHDEIGQSLTGLNFTLAMAMRGETDAARDHLERAAAISHDLLEQVRHLSIDLRPAVLDDLGLVPALVALAERFTARTGIDVDLRHQGHDRRLQADVETAAYRAVQEGLTNVARHAGVETASVQLLIDSTLMLWVSDTGSGFDLEASRTDGASFGLAGIAERVRLAGGTFRIDSSPNEGTTLVVELPAEPIDDQPEELAP